MAAPAPEPTFLLLQSYLNSLGIPRIPLGYTLVISGPDFTPRLMPTAEARRLGYLND